MNQVFPMVPASAKALWVMAVILVPLISLLGYSAYASRHTKFEVSESGLRIHGGLYGRTIPAESLVCSRAKAVDLKADPSLKPGLKTNGIGLPGYQAGWFHLKNGEKALVFLTDRSSVAYIPTREGYSLVLSVKNVPVFLNSIRDICR